MQQWYGYHYGEGGEGECNSGSGGGGGGFAVVTQVLWSLFEDWLLGVVAIDLLIARRELLKDPWVLALLPPLRHVDANDPFGGGGGGGGQDNDGAAGGDGAGEEDEEGRGDGFGDEEDDDGYDTDTTDSEYDDEYDDEYRGYHNDDDGYYHDDEDGHDHDHDHYHEQDYDDALDAPLTLETFGTQYLFSLYRDLLVWAAKVLSHALLVWCVVEACSAHESAAPVAHFLEEWATLPVLASLWAVEGLARAHQERLLEVARFVHGKLLEERYLVGWRLHNVHGGAEAPPAAAAPPA